MKKHANRLANVYLIMGIVILICAVVLVGGARSSEGGARPRTGVKGAPQNE